MKNCKRIFFITSAATHCNDAVTGRIEGYKLFCDKYNFELKIISASFFHRSKILNSSILISPLKSMLVFLEMVFKVCSTNFIGSKLIVSVPKYFTLFSILPILRMRSCDYYVEYRDAYPRVIFEKLGLPNYTVEYLTQIILKYTHRSNDVLFFTDRFELLNEYSPFESYFLPNGASISNLKLNDRERTVFQDHLKVCSVGRLGKFQCANLLHSEVKEFINHNSVKNIIVCGDLLKLKSEKIKNYGRVSSTEIAELIQTCNIGLSYRDESLSSDVNIPVRIWEYLNSGLYIRTNKTTGLEILSYQLAERFSINPFSFIEDECVERLLQRVIERPRLNEFIGKFTRLKNLENSKLVEILK